MKIAAGQIAAAVDRPAAGVRLYLFYGPDESAAMDYAARLGRAVGHDSERIDLDGAALKARPGVLADEAASMSLFGEPRWIRVTAVAEDSLVAIEGLLAAAVAGNPVVAIGPGLKGTGKLVKTVTAASSAVVHGCYVPEGPQAVHNASAIARGHGLRLMNDVAEAIVDAAGGDRAIIAREIEKLALYLDAAPDRPREAEMSALDAIGANLTDSGMFGAIEAMIDGRPDVHGTELATVDPNATIPLLRQIAKRLIALADMREEVDAGVAPDALVERRRVFFKERAGTVRALRRWSSPQLSGALNRVRRAERALLSSGTAGAVVADAECLAVARAAARLG
jgi:DNA polymerase-3 subunit delta